jgi:hypothetical protein
LDLSCKGDFGLIKQHVCRECQCNQSSGIKERILMNATF